MDLIILGPSNSGKTYLANYLASQINLPIFNVDSVQIYKYLNCLTSKPDFSNQLIEKEEVVSFLPLQKEFNFEKYKNIKFEVWIKKASKLEKKEFTDIHNLIDFLSLPETINLYFDHNRKSDNSIKNFLFDIREPFQSYSTNDFEIDLKRISQKFNLQDKIIVGGTIYYAFNYLFQLNNLENLKDNEVSDLEDTEYTLRELILKLENLDPEALKIIDIKNPRRIESALNFIARTGKKYSEDYLKELKLRNNFILINLWPEDREEYYDSLDKIIDARFNEKSLEELTFLINKYGEEVIPWLQKVSYEYKYFLDVFFTTKNSDVQWSPKNLFEKSVKNTLQVLKYKEHQYAKRQMTFLKRLERKIQEYVN